MKILFVVNQVPFPPDNGVRIVTHHAMRLMKERGHELALAVLTEEADDPGARFGAAAALCADGMAWWMPLPSRNRLNVQLAAMVHGNLHFVERYQCAAFAQRLRRLIDTFRPDVIHFDIITLAQYVALTPPGVGSIASINDSNALTLENALNHQAYSGFRRLYRQSQLRHVRTYEAATYARFDAVHLMSEVDAAYLRRLNPRIRTEVISNGVDPSMFGIPDERGDPLDLIFVGRLVGDNLEGIVAFLEKCWAVIEANVPTARLHVVGGAGPDARALLAPFVSRGGVIVHGHVAALAEVYSRSGIAVVPINKDCGIINKVIEAMAAGVAVVGFAKSFAGIREGQAGRDFIAARDFAAFGQGVLGMLQDVQRRRSVQMAGRALAREYYSWSTRAGDYEEMYRRAVSHARGGGP